MAIAFDTAVDGGNVVPGTSLTWSHTCTGSNLLLFVGVRENATPTQITGVTYNSVALTKIGENNPTSGAERISLWYLAGPATGANNVVVSASPATIMTGLSASYTGCSQTGIPDASKNTNQSTGTSITDSVTSIADNCWAIIHTQNQSGATTAGAGTTLRISAGSGEALLDNNAAKTPAGSITLIGNWGASGANSDIIASFAPPGASPGTTTSPLSTLALMGAG